MGVQYNSRIVTDGLVLALDAGNVKSSYKNFIKAKVYSVFNGGLRSANYSVQYSDDNSNWTTAFSGVCSNNTSCGIQENTGLGNGSYGYRRYWRYVEGSAVVSHHPRVSRIILTDVNGVDYNLIVYTSDNCSDTGTYIVGTVSVDFATNIWTDLSGRGNNGTITNGPTYSSANGGSIVFDGTDDRVVITNNELARIGTGNHTITAWVNNDIVTEEDFVGTGTSNGDVLLMIYSQAGGGAGGFRGHAWSSTGNSNTIDSPRAIGTGNWSMLTQRVTWGGNIDLFENGVLTASQVLSGGAPTSSRTKFIIGCRADGGDSSHFDGRIANVQVYNRALTAAEIQQNFNATRGRFGI